MGLGAVLRAASSGRRLLLLLLALGTLGPQLSPHLLADLLGQCAVSRQRVWGQLDTGGLPGLLLLLLLGLFLLFLPFLLLVGFAGKRQVSHVGRGMVGAEVGLRGWVVGWRLHQVEGVVLAEAGGPGGFGC